MIFQFHQGDALISIMIRLLTGKYNHVSIRVGNYVYEAHIKKGVTKTLYSKWNSSSVVETIEVKSKNEKKVKLWLDKQVGKKYDVSGILSFLSIFSKPKIGKWYCSELSFVAYAKLKGVEGNIEGQKISPYLFYVILQLC